MNLVPCRECQKEISPQANTCPHCGAPLPAQKDWQGWGYEWRTKTQIYGYPLIHIAYGRDQNRKLRVAKGIIAIGQFGIGLITIAQFGVGILFGFGQFMVGLTAIAQFAIAGLFGFGQFATGFVAIGQFALGYYALAQIGFAKYLWSSVRKDPEAVEFFNNMLMTIKKFIGQ